MCEGFAMYNRRTNKLEGIKECAVLSTTELKALRLRNLQLERELAQIRETMRRASENIAALVSEAPCD